MNLLELQTKIHEQNKAVGWWDEPRPFSTFACLFHSELSEAMEGDRKNLMDDHLPEYEMFWVEVADFAIRCMDWLGSKDWRDYDGLSNPKKNPRIDFLSEMHLHVSTSYRASRDHMGSGYEVKTIAHAVHCCFIFAVYNDVDLFKIVNEKVAYNLTRADHKRENRALDNGKKY